MQLLTIILRLLHVVLGIFWAGTLFFLVLFLQPAVQAMGPDGGRFMQRLAERRIFEILPVVALLTILAGIALYWRVSSGFQAVYVLSGTGLTLAAGGLSAIVAFTIGILMMRPATMQMLALLPTISAGGPTPEQQRTLGALRRQARIASQLVAVFIALAVLAMAVARYMY